MSPGGVYSLATFLTGVILLLGWAYLTIGNPRSGALFRKSLWLFVLPILLAPWSSLSFPLSMWLLVAIEEGLKTYGAHSEESAVDRFWLISLFGLWELTLDKPFWGFVLASEISSWNRPEVAGLLFSTALPVLMHVVTAAIYAFRFKGRLWAAFLVCWFIHTAFNEAVTYFYLSIPAACIETIVLLAILTAALPKPARLPWSHRRDGQPMAPDQPA